MNLTDQPRPLTRAADGVPSSASLHHSLTTKLILWVSLLTLCLLPLQGAIAAGLPDFETLVEQQGKTVVKVTVTTESQTVGFSGAMPDFGSGEIPDFLRKFFEQMPQMPEQKRRGQGFGSGFIISEDGYIVTNAHVVENAVDIRVSMQDRSSYQAELVGLDKRTDVAVLKIDADGLPVARLGDSDEVKVGQWVLAIGSPFGFEYTATQGIVSAVARSLPDDTYVPFIQTDVAVNPGNSGGPLFDTEGRVVGVNSQIYSRSGGYMGLSFAIPINVAMDVVDQLRTKGYASRGWLGVVIQNVDQALAESFGLSHPEGALVSQVMPDGPAADSDLEVGDIIVEFDGHHINRSSDLPPVVGATRADTSVPVKIIRAGKEKTIKVKVGELEDDRVATGTTDKGATDSVGLGATVKDLNSDEKEQLQVENGVLVTAVDPDSPAATTGIVAGDVIVAFNRENVKSVSQLRELIKDAPRGKSFPVLIQREGSPAFLAMTLDKK
ncbi:DegQ family serine endoprotease [Granulosicoccaceae sp. 1_MG-2023]|nr:DegQ family serine endoprotease [Granulosicoccaceae sp. 1_MG-2023]